jgi:hypothetical protein
LVPGAGQDNDPPSKKEAANPSMSSNQSDTLSPRAGRSSGLFGRPLLLLICIGPNLLEAALLLWRGPSSGLSLAPQATAVVPFGLFHDLRWLVVYHDSWLGFGLEAAGLVLARGVITALTIKEAWPEGRPRPSLARLITRGTAFTAATAVLLVPWVLILFSLAVVSVSWLFFAAVPSVVAMALLVHQVAISRDWWRRAPAPRALGWIALTFVVGSVASLTISTAPRALALPVAGLTGLFNAWAWYGLVHAVAGRRERVRFRFVPVVPAGVAGFWGLAIGGTILGFTSVAQPAAAQPLQPATTAPRDAQPVLVVNGFGSSWNGRSSPPLPGSYLEWTFSYRGMGRNGRPLAYDGANTAKSLPTLDRLMGQEVSALHRLTGQPVDIVGESEGALVAKTFLVATPQAPVHDLVMVSPLVDPGRVYYPPTGASGYGVAAAAGLRGISDTLQALAPIDLSPTDPFLRSIIEESPQLGTVLSCQVSHVRQFEVVPLADAVASPSPIPVSIPTAVVPAFHGGLIGTATADRVIDEVLEGQTPATTNALDLADTVIRQASAAWQVPTLVASDNPVWQVGAHGESTSGQTSAGSTTGRASVGPSSSTCAGIGRQLAAAMAVAGS